MGSREHSKEVGLRVIAELILEVVGFSKEAVRLFGGGQRLVSGTTFAFAENSGRVIHLILEGNKTHRKPPYSVSPTRLMSALNFTILIFAASEDTRLVASAASAATILAAAVACYALSFRAEKHEFPKLWGIQIYYAWNFFQRQFYFLHSSFERNFGKSFSFSVLHHHVVALTGEDARQAFYSDPHLSVSEGLLMGAGRVSLQITKHSIDLGDLRRLGSGMLTRQLKRTTKGTSPSSTKS